MHRTDTIDGEIARAFVTPLVFTPGKYAVILRGQHGGERSLCETSLADAFVIADAINAQHPPGSPPPGAASDPGAWYASKNRTARFLALTLQHEREQLQPDVIASIERDLDAARYVGD